MRARLSSVGLSSLAEKFHPEIEPDLKKDFQYAVERGDTEAAKRIFEQLSIGKPDERIGYLAVLLNIREQTVEESMSHQV